MTFIHKEYGEVFAQTLKKSKKGCKWGLYKIGSKSDDEPLKLFKTVGDVFAEIRLFRVQEDGVDDEDFFDDLRRVIDA